ncbi:exopolyphosphatase [Streptomyces cirratus]
MTRVAGIDCGTNSIRLLVADCDPATGDLVELDRRMIIVRLGQGVDRTGRLAPEALERTFAACREYAAVIKELGAERVRFVATSASRDAENRDEFVQGVLDILGVEPEVITGDQEAEFSFTGATKELTGRTDLERPFLVVDIGGGSTEFVVGSEHVEAARSVDVGCVRMTERHLVVDGVVSDPPTEAQVAAIRADVEAALDLASEAVPLDRARTLVGLAGSVTTVAAIRAGPARVRVVGDPPRPDPVRGGPRDHRADADLHAHAEREAIAVMHPGRVDVIGAGALVLLAIMDRVGAREVVVSEHDILDGIAWSVA